ncbi:metalloregulator ArsR/SmtB family transcription factor [Amycolatopsis sp. NPDC051071]|uniref:ArsR/SmtB family transcription factor n=1 Tax=Amycolatopsis sp. NPDC051071 TaxID=3154637 RepID=UPI00341AFC7B
MPSAELTLLSLDDAPREIAGQWAPLFRALGDPVRLEIVLLLVREPRTVKQLQTALKLSQALVSHHLRLLREQDIVVATARGRSNIYEVCAPPLACLAQCLESMVSSTAPAGPQP